MADVSNYEDVMDSRDVVERIEELEGERQELADATEEESDAAETLKAWDESSEGQELAALKAFREELEDYCGDKWTDGVTLIRDSHFEGYAQELAEELGMIKESSQWPYTCIDWAQAARELQQDYTSGEFSGITYWAR